MTHLQASKDTPYDHGSSDGNHDHSYIVTLTDTHSVTLEAWLTFTSACNVMTWCPIVAVTCQVAALTPSSSWTTVGTHSTLLQNYTFWCDYNLYAGSEASYCTELHSYKNFMHICYSNYISSHLLLKPLVSPQLWPLFQFLPHTEQTIFPCKRPVS